MPEELLAERPLLGYPDTRVELHMDLKTKVARVVVIDPQGETVFTDPDAFLHPFVFGYQREDA